MKSTDINKEIGSDKIEEIDFDYFDKLKVVYFDFCPFFAPVFSLISLFIILFILSPGC